MLLAGSEVKVKMKGKLIYIAKIENYIILLNKFFFFNQISSPLLATYARADTSRHSRSF